MIDEGDDTTLGKEQDILDKHDDEVSALTIRLQKLITTCSSISAPDARKMPARKLTRLEKKLAAMNKWIDSLTGGEDESCLIQQFEEEVVDLRRELGNARDDLLPTIGFRRL